MVQDMVMKKPIEIWQGVLATLLFLLTVGTIIVNQSNKIATQEVKIMQLQEDKQEMHSQLHEIILNLKEMNNKLSDVQIAIVNKKDRDK